MSAGPQKFTLTELRRAIKATAQAGFPNSTVRLTHNGIEIALGTPDAGPSANDNKGTDATWEALDAAPVPKAR